MSDHLLSSGPLQGETGRETMPRRLRREGGLGEHLDLSAKRCIDLAGIYLKQPGVADGQAWSWAIREVLLESEQD